MKKQSLLLLLTLLAFTFACNLPAGATPTPAGSIFTQAALTITAAAGENTATTIPAETSTPLPTSAIETATQLSAATNTPVCNLASFVSDVTIPDNTNITVNKGFTKTWRLRNVGACTWTSGYQIVFDSGDQMSGPASQQLTNGTVAPGQTVDVSVDLKSPVSPDTYKGNWKLKDPNGVIFALSTGPFWVQIKATAVAEAEWPTIKINNTGHEVFAIQHLLRAHGYDLNVDGIFGPITQSRVEDFQTDNNLVEDGFVGPETWQKLIIQVQQGKTGQEVRAVQRLLRDKFGYNISVDGIFGPDTANAVKQFQTANGLSSDGIVGPKTWQKLIEK
ncbi:MAG: peptidoglycan-binding protein [Anaerolineales bacterium]|nr:peptidoglycan-binding protein [Anaerolineales bacterium]